MTDINDKLGRTAMNHLGTFVLGACLFVSTFCASANDTIGRVGIGGITFEKSDQIRMLKEELEISTSKVRVLYRFKNESNVDIHTTVLFPTPGQSFVHPEVVSYNMDSVTTFSVKVDGKSVNTKVLRQAIYNGKDITDKLRKVGFNEEQIFKTFGGYDYEPMYQVLTWHFSKEQKSKLISQLGKDFFGKDGEPRWKVDETFCWEQVFPAAREIEVTHEYSPFVGTENLGKLTVDHCEGGTCFSTKEGYQYSLGGEACLDKGALAYLNKAKGAYVTTRGVEYILGTGRNWKGPIGDFTLRLIKNSPSQIVSLCFPGKPQKINPTTLEFKHANFVPQDKLVVYFIGGSN
jgi:hypothetical protein